MTLPEALKLLCPDEQLLQLEEALSQRARRIVLKGLPGSAATALFSRLKPRKAPLIVVADDAEAAGYLYHDLVQIAGQQAVAFLPSGYRRDIRYGQPDEAQLLLRTEALDAWRRKETRWLVTSPEALAEKVPAPEQVENSSMILTKGQKVQMSEIAQYLVREGFSTVDYVYEPGQFARRGSILDVYSYAHDMPLRIDFFDDEIDSIRLFDIETQLSQKMLDQASLMPSAALGDPDKKVSFLEFAGSAPLVAAHNFAFLEDRVREIASQTISEAVALTGEGDPHAMRNVVDPDAFSQALRKGRLIAFGGNPAVPDGFGNARTFDFNCSPQGLYHKNFELIAQSFTNFIDQGYRIFILTDSAYQGERLDNIFRERGDRISFTTVDRTLHQGFVAHDTRTCFFTDHQIFDRFHKYSLRSDRARSGKMALSLKELGQIEPGDFIVHIDHGIGKFAGLVKAPVNGHMQEMIKLVYLNDDMIFVSLHSLHKLSKYRGKEGIPPKVNKLGGGAWHNLKERTKSKLKDIARDLIRLYARRREEKGFAFSPDSYLQQELEASFIYEDTPDQLKAVAAVKADMEQPRPMDRLICGDVGFGKTEVAIRAAFKAACDSKQTAVLVPTTVLAHQHYKTFSQRLKDLPVRVDFLSRARSAKQTREILADLEAGKIDILIGTHKIIGKAVKFKDLGLLVIDEEQKFGVAVKEKLKQLKVNVDTLTMSATPIPRTLQFSLMGARDLSSLATPPANRRPIVTQVVPVDDDVIRDAIGFEMSRNGQVFFISNRIQDLDDLEIRIRRLVPGVRVIKAHGQMPPDKLEKAIEDFSAQDYDVLLSTTIVENGIDMPNVNTILVYNSQNFGLSELHQLRGRVGRSSRKAFCYLLVPPHKPLAVDARRRLQAIETFSDLGSGIHIAMQDLDIRGAGNLLGAEQSGFIADLGYEAYQKILKEAVLELKTDEFADEFADLNKPGEEEFTAECTVESDLELLLPATYVPQDSERISLYQQLDNMESEQQVEEFRQRLRDRFGAIPPQAEELIRIVPLRSIAKKLGIERINLKGGKMYLFFVPQSNAAYYQSQAFGKVLQYAQTEVRRCHFRQDPLKGRNSIIVDEVADVLSALDILKFISSINPVKS